MASCGDYKTIVLKNQWETWINTYIDYECNITVYNYIGTVLGELIDIYNGNHIPLLRKKTEIINDALNFYFNVWRTSSRKPRQMYFLTRFGRLQQKKGQLPTMDMYEYLDRIFSDSFWKTFQKKYGPGSDLFDPEISEFGWIFWENIRHFLHQYINTGNLRELLGSTSNLMDFVTANDTITQIGDNITSLNGPVQPTVLSRKIGPLDDPYVLDQINSKKSSILENT